MKSSVFFAAALAATIPAQSFAQQQGIGFPIGEKSRLHVNADLGVAYDTNPDREISGSPGDQENLRGTVRPSFRVAVPSSNYDFGLGAGLTISRYFGLEGSEADTNIGGDIGVNFALGSKQSTAQLNFRDNLIRTPTYIADLGAVTAEERRFAGWLNRGLLGVTLRPGGGALEFEIDYTNVLYFLQDLPDAQLHTAVLESRWRFLPKTAAFVRADFGFFEPIREGDTSPRSTPYSAQLGLRGQVTSHISINLAAGFGDALTWSDSFFSSVSPANRRSFIGQASVSYALSESLRATLGYVRGITPVILLGNYISDTLSARLNWSIGRLQIGGYADYEFRRYGFREAQNIQLLTGDARADFWFTDYLIGFINYRILKQRAENVTVAMGDDLDFFLGDYTRQTVFVGVGLRY